MNRKTSQSRGFTLLELIVAMMMVSIIAASLYSSLNAAVRGKRASERAVGPIRAVGTALNIIERDLDSVMIPSIETLNPDSLVLYLAGPFQSVAQGGGGSAAWLSFYCMGSDSTPDLPLAEGARRVEIALSNEGGNQNLVRRVARNLLSGDVNIPAEEEEVLCENVRSFTMRFFDGLEWQETWDSTQLVDINGVPAIPMLVQMELILDILDLSKPELEPRQYVITKLIPITCAKAVDAEQTALVGQTLP